MARPSAPLDAVVIDSNDHAVRVAAERGAAELGPIVRVITRRNGPNSCHWVGRGGFEPPKATPTGLQPVPFGHSGTDPGLLVTAGPHTILPMPDPSFDIVSEVDVQELRNAAQQAQREIATRFDFKNSGASLELDDKVPAFTLRADTEARVAAVLDVLKDKLVKRKVSLKALQPGKLEPAAKSTFRQVVAVSQGIADERAKALTKEIRDLKLKVQAQIQGQQVRVTGKARAHGPGVAPVRLVGGTATAIPKSAAVQAKRHAPRSAADCIRFTASPKRRFSSASRSLARVTP